MKFNVTEVEFDFDTEYISKDERIEITQDHLGVWEATDEDDLIEEVTTSSGWCIKNIDYEIQLKQCHKVLSISIKNGLLQYYKQIQTFFPIMKKVAKTQKTGIKYSVLLDKLSDLGWEYTCNRMSRSGMQVYDEIMQYMHVLEPNEHWNEDAYTDKNGDW